MFDVFSQQLTPPDILIYLHAPVNKLQGNIKREIENLNKPYQMTIYLEFKKPTQAISNSIK